jgi:gluconolactonase
MLHKSIACLLLLLAGQTCFGQDMKLTDILIDGEGWHEKAKGYGGIRWLEADAKGGLLIAHDKGLDRLDADGKVTTEGKTAGPRTVLARGGYSYRIDDTEKGVRMQPPTDSSAKDKLFKTEGLSRPAGLVLWPDGGTLVVGDAGGAALWAFRIDKDGSLTSGDRYYYPVRTQPGRPCGVTGLTVDRVGRVYAATTEGVQVFDPTGRLIGVLPRPSGGDLSGIALGGPAGDTLFVACGEKVYTRKTKARSVWAKEPGK